ncbi:haloacid dehalogenase, type II [Aspergillus piperis CBS 112811]|uniref:Haloacid dehalogenase, type II n=1 Tax=Aspergillus piperis CBS 112811 TaxID=1448313 RepID=A0A8G1QXP1_9EURO|nr:haloacid dehalogenase, type II [Aspergillus piperis CBS 112811]RAH54901.1 haloacid dehalogenase, type II [Aspergillus piperis CBS 112811]
MMGDIVLAFDIYGTLLSFEAVIHELKRFLNDDARARTVAQTWRRYQLEYTFRLNSMGRYLTFLEVTRNSLLHALDDTGTSLGDKEIEHLMATYNRLIPFPDVEDALNQLSAFSQVTSVIFSNGTRGMIANCVESSTVLSQHKTFFRDVVSVDEVKQYKPAPAVYSYLAKCVGRNQSEMKDIWLVSGNPFDIAGARNVGMNAIWVDRAEAGWVDKALPDVKPTAIVHHLGGIVDVIKQQLSL